MKKLKTVERQYSFFSNQKYKFAEFGLMSAQTWVDDPKRLVFLLARYKFVSKLVNDTDLVLEVGCADGFGSRIVAQHCAKIACSDFDPIFIKNAKSINRRIQNMSFYQNDFCKKALKLPFLPTASFCLDVLEHIKPIHEDKFINNLINSCSPRAKIIFGSPSFESQAYASETSKRGHVNCKTGKNMRETMQRYFSNVI